MTSKLITLCFTLFVACVASINVESATYQIVESDFFESKQAWAIIEITFDEQPYYSADGGFHSFKDYEEVDFEKLMLTGVFLCGEDHINHCSDTPNDHNAGIIALPPISSPIQAVHEYITKNYVAAFNTFTAEFGWTVNSGNLPVTSTKPNTYAGLVQLWEEDKDTQVRKVCFPEWKLISKTCPLAIAPPTDLGATIPFNATGICDQSGDCFNNQVIPYDAKPPKCDQVELETAIQELRTSLDFDPLTINNPPQLIIKFMEVQSRMLDAAILDCRDLAISLATFGPESITSVTNLCRKPLFLENGNINPGFIGDACCNPRRAFSECCDARSVTYEVYNVESVIIDRVNECEDPAAATNTLFDLNQIITNLDELCGAEQGWNDANIWFKETFGPIQTCIVEVFAKSCNSDTECPTGICFQGLCVPPLDNPSPYLTGCLAANLDPITARFWRNEWGLTGNATAEEFAEAFRDYVYSDVCIGPTNYEDPPTTESDCEAIMHCNYNPELDESTCLANSNPNFCGFCPGQVDPKYCWDLSVASRCIVFGSQEECTTAGKVWDIDWNVCTDPSATNSSICNGFWFDGFYNTPSKCDEGFCLGVEYGISRADCESRDYCTRSCPGCASLSSGLCFTSEPVNETTCTSNSGIYYDGLCVFHVDQTTCTQNGGEWRTCSSRTTETCTTGLDARVLGCYVDDFTDCTTQGSCESQGECDDYVISSNSDSNGGCIKPYTIGFDGEASCDSGWNDARVGCINPDLSQAACALADHQWRTRATTKAACELTKACREPSRSTFTNKDEESCSSCNGDYVSVFNWIPGKWIAGKSLPLTYGTRGYVQSNTWGRGLAWNNGTFIKLLNVLIQPLGTKFAYRAKNEGYCRIGYYSLILQQLSASCGSNAKRGSLSAIGYEAQIGIFKVFSGLKQKFTAAGVTIETTPTTITVDNQEILLYATSLTSLSSQAAYEAAVEQSRKRQTQGALTIDIGVSNDNDIRIGQVLSDGIRVDFSGDHPLGDTYRLCVPRRNDIKSTNCFPTYDFASGSPLRPLNKVITYSDDEQVCADFETTDLVFAIRRVDDWATVNEDIECQDLSTTGAGTGITTTSSSSTTSDSESDSRSSVSLISYYVIAILSIISFAFI